jgi:hypothetical protein
VGSARWYADATPLNEASSAPMQTMGNLYFMIDSFSGIVLRNAAVESGASRESSFMVRKSWIYDGCNRSCRKRNSV